MISEYLMLTLLVPTIMSLPYYLIIDSKNPELFSVNRTYSKLIKMGFLLKID